MCLDVYDFELSQLEVVTRANQIKIHQAPITFEKLAEVLSVVVSAIVALTATVLIDYSNES
jgi:hypothetical protein